MSARKNFWRPGKGSVLEGAIARRYAGIELLQHYYLRTLFSKR